MEYGLLAFGAGVLAAVLNSSTSSTTSTNDTDSKDMAYMMQVSKRYHGSSGGIVSRRGEQDNGGTFSCSDGSCPTIKGGQMSAAVQRQRQRNAIDKRDQDGGFTVPFRMIRENPVIPILLDGDSDLSCHIVDCGYSLNAISDSCAKRLKLKGQGDITVQTVDSQVFKKAMLPSGVVYDYDTSEPIMRFPESLGVIRPLPYTMEATFGRGKTCMKEGGILGVSFLENFVTKIDFRDNLITFYDPQIFKYHGNGVKYNSFLQDEQYFVIPVNIDGVVANCILDTGAFATIMTKGFLKKYYNAKGKPFGYSGNDGSIDATFSDSPVTLSKKIVPRFEVGDLVLRNKEILYPECNNAICPGLLESKRFDGLLGYDTLKNFVVYLNYDNSYGSGGPYAILESH